MSFIWSFQAVKMDKNDRHLRTLNPHLEHAMFDAHFETEPLAFVAA